MKTLAILLAMAAAGFIGQQYQAQQSAAEITTLKGQLKNWQDYSFSEGIQNVKNIEALIKEGNELDAADLKIQHLQSSLQAATATVPCVVRYGKNDTYYCQPLALGQASN